MKVLIRIFFLGLLTINSYSQDPELGVFGGASYYLGDLNPYGHFKQSNPAFGGLYRFNTKNNRIVYRVNAFYGTVSGNDAKSNDQNHIERNLNFSSTVLEIGPMLEINFFEYELGNTSRKEYVFATPYLFAGITLFKMNPKGEYNGEWIELQPLATEGQETSQNSSKRYKLNQLSIPLGLGFKFNVNKRFAMSFEYGIRKTFTDYIDDVSGKYVDADLLTQEAGELSGELSNRSIGREGGASVNSGYARGNSKNKDWYAFAGMIVSFKLFTNTQCKRNFKK